MRRRHYSTYAIPFIAMLAACGGGSGGGCSCLKPIPGGFPTDTSRHANAMQVRVTQGALDYLSQNGGALVDGLLPNGGQKFTVPAQCGGSTEVCCNTPACVLDIGISNLSLGAKPPSTLTFSVEATLKSETDLTLGLTIVGIKQNCLIGIDTSKGAIGAQFVTLSGNLDFSVDGTTNLTSLSLDNSMLADLDNSMLSISGVGFLDQGCNLANVGFIKTAIIGQLQSQITGQLSTAVDNALCTACMAKSDCDGYADACTSMQCSRAGKCLQEIGATGQLDLTTLSKLFAATKAKMDILTVLGGYADVTPAPTSGLSLGLLGGALAAPHNPCVPKGDPAAPPVVAKWAEYTGELDPADGKTPYHVGIGIHQSQLDTVGFAAYDSGAICVDVGSSTIPQLDAKTIGIILPSLADLLHDQDAPMILSLRPQQPPTFTIGAGTFTVDANGNKTILDPLMTIQMPQLNIDFYAFVDERYIRIMTLVGDINLPLSLDVDGMGKIAPILGNLDNVIQNLTVTNNQLLTEDPVKLAKTFPMLLSLASGALGNLGSFAIPSVMGINLKVVGIEPTDNQTFVSIFASLNLAAPETFHARTIAEVSQVQTPPTEAFRATTGLDPVDQPSVVLSLGGAGKAGDASDLEWSTQIDGGTWSLYARNAHPNVTDPRLWLQGRHTVAVRARVTGEPSTVDAVPVSLDFLVDTIAPAGGFDVAGGEISISASDLVSPVEALEYSFRVAGTAAEESWSPWTHGDRINVGAEVDPSAIFVRARDEAGNIGTLSFHGRTTTPVTASACACSLGAAHEDGSERAPLALSLLVLIGLVFRRRRAAMTSLTDGNRGDGGTSGTDKKSSRVTDGEGAAQ